MLTSFVAIVLLGTSGGLAFLAGIFAKQRDKYKKRWQESVDLLHEEQLNSKLLNEANDIAIIGPAELALRVRERNRSGRGGAPTAVVIEVLAGDMILWSTGVGLDRAKSRHPKETYAQRFEAEMRQAKEIIEIYKKQGDWKKVIS